MRAASLCGPGALGRPHTMGARRTRTRTPFCRPVPASGDIYASVLMLPGQWRSAAAAAEVPANAEEPFSGACGHNVARRPRCHGAMALQ